jgi:flagellar motor protein MotB
MERTLACLLSLSLIASTLAAGAASTEKEKAAVTATESWLEKVDQARYAESWQEAAEPFRKAVTQAQWEQSLKAARQPLGKRLTRKVKSTAYATTLPGAPDGEYVVIQFESSFENKQAAVETVTPMLEKDGRWRVSGYFIK